MTEQTPEGTSDDQQQTGDQQGGQGNPDDLGDAGKQAIARMKAERDAERRTARQARAELEQLRNATATDQEKAILAARKEGETTAARTFGTRLAQTAFDAAAGRRNPDFDTAAALQYVDLTRFLGEDGEPDTAAINAAVERLVPAPAAAAPGFDGGTRTPPAKAGDMNSIIRKAAGLA